ncbi:MAG: hypothetical protein J6A92_07435 [Lachnospiraceae bacterium]|nr:hypothetical protein [Lachnospiraceae bacterium]
MNIFLLILKILGILLLVFLGIIIILLFHPVYYKGKGELEEDISIEAVVWWLFQIIRLEISVKDKTFHYKVRIFGKTFLSNEEQTAEKTIQEDTPVTQTVVPPADSSKSDEKDFLENFAENLEEQESDFSKTDNIVQKQITKFSEWKHIFGRIKTEYKDEKNRLAVTHIWKEILYLLKHIKPKDIHATLDFSAGNPATTGQITGVLSLFPFIYKQDVLITPDFLADTFYVKGNFALKGHIQLLHICIIFIRIIRDRNIRRMIHRIRRK